MKISRIAPNQHQKKEATDDNQGEVQDEFWENAYEGGQWRKHNHRESPKKVSPRMKYEASKAWADTPVDKFRNRQMNHTNEMDTNCLSSLTNFAKEKVSQVVNLDWSSQQDMTEGRRAQLYDAGGTGESEVAHNIRVGQIPYFAVQQSEELIPSDDSSVEQSISQNGLLDFGGTDMAGAPENRFSPSDDRLTDSSKSSSNPDLETADFQAAHVSKSTMNQSSEFIMASFIKSFSRENANRMSCESNGNKAPLEIDHCLMQPDGDLMEQCDSVIDNIKNQLEYSDDVESCAAQATSSREGPNQSLVEAGEVHSLKAGEQVDDKAMSSSSGKTTKLGIASRIWNKCLGALCFLLFLLSCLKYIAKVFVKQHVLARMDKWLKRYEDDPQEQVNADASASCAAAEADGSALEKSVCNALSARDSTLSEVSSEANQSTISSSQDVVEYKRLCKEAIRILRELDNQLDIATEEEKPVYLNLLEDFSKAAMDLYRESLNKGEVAAGDN